MDHDPWWIDRAALRALVAETAWQAPKYVVPLELPPEPSDSRSAARFGRVPPPRPPTTREQERPRVGTRVPDVPTSMREHGYASGRDGDRLTRASRPLRPGSIDPNAITIRVPPPPPPAYVRSAADPYLTGRPASIDERLEQLLVWALESSGMESAFVADREGQLVAERDVDSSDEASTTVFEQFLRQFEGFVDGRVDGHVLLRAGPRRLLVTWRYTARGRYYLGLAGRNEPPVDSVGPLGQALVDALEVR